MRMVYSDSVLVSLALVPHFSEQGTVTPKIPPPGAATWLASKVCVPHPKWQERPLAAVVLKEGAEATPEELRAYLAKTFAKWQLPDAFVFMSEIPRTSVGKFKKTALREQFSDWQWD